MNMQKWRIIMPKYIVTTTATVICEHLVDAKDKQDATENLYDHVIESNDVELHDEEVIKIESWENK